MVEHSGHCMSTSGGWGSWALSPRLSLLPAPRKPLPGGGVQGLAFGVLRWASVGGHSPRCPSHSLAALALVRPGGLYVPRLGAPAGLGWELRGDLGPQQPPLTRLSRRLSDADSPFSPLGPSVPCRTRWPSALSDPPPAVGALPLPSP